MIENPWESLLSPIYCHSSHSPLKLLLPFFNIAKQSCHWTGVHHSFSLDPSLPISCTFFLLANSQPSLYMLLLLISLPGWPLTRSDDFTVCSFSTLSLHVEFFIRIVVGYSESKTFPSYPLCSLFYLHCLAYCLALTRHSISILIFSLFLTWSLLKYS